MGLTKQNQRIFYKNLYRGWLESVTLLKRNNDQQQGTVTSYTLANVRPRRIYHTGEAIDGSMASADKRGFLIPDAELAAVGLSVRDINALDVIVDENGRHWQPEAPKSIEIKLGGNYVGVECVRIK